MAWGRASWLKGRRRGCARRTEGKGFEPPSAQRTQRITQRQSVNGAWRRLRVPPVGDLGRMMAIHLRGLCDLRDLCGGNLFGDPENAGGGVDAESSTMRRETRFNLPRGAIFGYHRARFEESSGECRLIMVNSNS